ncbi:hypothetical protein [Methylobacterium goesingense]|uniref:DNA-directed RNA polymerase subunit RPC12/RpoP n=1 Tax=Methylobacterium goesingense TaxID=243690 RepID=A0ABV2LFV2_9HYPH|nr:hypothetical protein [Methylobacterium goesingense]GJD76582.1 hypothetical protein CFIICLFH_4840 [Methylobacterium goesingense]
MDKNEVWRRQDEFRALAQNSAERARTLLAEDDDRSVTYAALELRFGLEALIYAHAINYLDELGDPKRLDWQAPKLLEQLIDIDPFADSTMFLRAVDPITGERHNVGIERRLDLKKLKKRYYKLGNALHAPSIASMDIKNHKNKTEWRSYCQEIIAVIDEVLASSAAVAGGAHCQIFQMNCSCGTVIRRRTDPLFVHRVDNTKGAPSIKVRCHNCVESVEVSINKAGDGFDVASDLLTYECPHKGCGNHNKIWEQELVNGKEVACKHCGGRILMSTMIRPVAS